MSEVAIFTYTDHEVRTVTIDGDPWFVAADVCAVLNIANPSDAIAKGLDDDEYQQVNGTLDTSEGLTNSRNPVVLVVSEAGLYSLILRSRKPEAKTFKRWITHDVIPAIRKTGSYSQAPALPQSYAEALRELAASVEREETARAELQKVTPSAEAWEHLATATGDYAVADAAKILCRDPLVDKIGQQRLFTYLSEIGWTHRNKGDRRWRVYQSAVDTGWISELASSHYHPRTGELVLDAPQVRVTVKGLGELHRRLRHKQQPLPSL